MPGLPRMISAGGGSIGQISYNILGKYTCVSRLLVRKSAKVSDLECAVIRTRNNDVYLPLVVSYCHRCVQGEFRIFYGEEWKWHDR